MRYSGLRRPGDHQACAIGARLAHLRYLFPGSHLPYFVSAQAALRRQQVRLGVPQQQILQLQAGRRALHTGGQNCTRSAPRHAHPQSFRTKKRSRFPDPRILPRLDRMRNAGQDFLPDLHGSRLFKDLKEEEDVPLLLINSVLLIPPPFICINYHE